MIAGVTLPNHSVQPCRVCLVPLTQVQLLSVLLMYSASSKQASNLLCWGVAYGITLYFTHGTCSNTLPRVVTGILTDQT